MPSVRQFGAEGLQAGADELGLPHGVAAGQRPDDAQEGRDDLGDFFSRAGRPPPGRRTRSAGRPSSESASSSRPRRMVSTCRPVIWETKRSPPWPILALSTAAYQRRCCSSSRLKQQVHLAVDFLVGMRLRAEAVGALALMDIMLGHGLTFPEVSSESMSSYQKPGT